MNAAMAVASGVGTIVAADRLGLAWGGVAATAGIVGTGAGALALTRLTGRRGRGRALAVGYLVGAVGAAVAAGGAVTDDVAALLIGMLLLGVGNSAAQLSRYAAAELHAEDRRGRAIGAVVWAGAVGAVGGPLLLGADRRARGGPVRVGAGRRTVPAGGRGHRAGGGGLALAAVRVEGRDRCARAAAYLAARGRRCARRSPSWRRRRWSWSR